MYLDVAIYQDAAEYIGLSRFKQGLAFSFATIASLTTEFGIIVACQDDSPTLTLQLPQPRPTLLRPVEI